jgi:glycosyltransferase involved in cell wall biosynthesis
VKGLSIMKDDDHAQRLREGADLDKLRLSEIDQLQERLRDQLADIDGLAGLVKNLEAKLESCEKKCAQRERDNLTLTDVINRLKAELGTKNDVSRKTFQYFRSFFQKAPSIIQHLILNAAHQQRSKEWKFAVDLLYRYYLGRTADEEGLRVHTNALRNGAQLPDVAQAIENSPEAIEGRQQRSASDAVSDGEFIVSLAEFLFHGRGALPDEVEDLKKFLGDDRKKRIELLKSAADTCIARQRQGDPPRNDPTNCWMLGTDRYLTAADWEEKGRELRLAGSESLRFGMKRSHQSFQHSGEYLVSAIASLYKARRYIEPFLDNIIGQTIFHRSELIIVDADSPQGEEQIISEYQKSFPNIIYQRINCQIGVYDAWNIGVKMARGRYLTNTNLDDRRRRDSFELQAATLDRHDFIDIVYQDFFYSLNDSLSFEEIEKFNFRSELPLITPHNLLKFNSPHNGPMWRKGLHAELGLFDTTYRSAGDWEFWLRCVSKGKNFLKINTPHIAYFQNPGGVSTKPDTLGLEEGLRILRKYSDKNISPELRMSRERFAEALGTVADWDIKSSYYDVVQREINRLGGRFRALERKSS